MFFGGPKPKPGKHSLSLCLLWPCPCSLPCPRPTTTCSWLEMRSACGKSSFQPCAACWRSDIRRLCTFGTWLRGCVAVVCRASPPMYRAMWSRAIGEGAGMTSRSNKDYLDSERDLKAKRKVFHVRRSRKDASLGYG
jgi:hypothetical protein